MLFGFTRLLSDFIWNTKEDKGRIYIIVNINKASTRGTNFVICGKDSWIVSDCFHLVWVKWILKILIMKRCIPSTLEQLKMVIFARTKTLKMLT